MSTLRITTLDEREKLQARGCIADNWETVFVSTDFDPNQLYNAHLSGSIEIGQGTIVTNSHITNYHIGGNCTIDSVVKLECRASNSFGNGVEVATMNECGGRSVKIYDRMTAQEAYIIATQRHNSALINRYNDMVDDYAASQESSVAHIGSNTTITASRIIREVNIGENVTICGASILEGGTICSEAFVGIDVKAYHFIIAESAKVDNGAIIERCFVGEAAIIANGFTAIDSLFFANTHCENGEAASIFAGPYTVSHHKSSLLIAGIFSFFNAGSGSNQSNHLFKSGAVHQAVHLRGTKFGSGAYIMAPAIEGPYSVVLGHHAQHHDTMDFPFSYLTESDGRTVLMPGANIISYGTERDIQKWPQRDKRKIKRDVINFERYNPYITELMVKGLNKLHSLKETNPDADSYISGKALIKAAHLKRGIDFYNKAIVASIGSMLDQKIENFTQDNALSIHWLDVAGQYIDQGSLDMIIEKITSGAITSLDEIGAEFHKLADNYTQQSYLWSLSLLEQLLGHAPSAEEVASAIESGRAAHENFIKRTDSDHAKDNSTSMAIGYGFDSLDDEEKMADYKAVRGL